MNGIIVTHMQENPVMRLLSEIASDLDEHASGGEIDLESRYEGAIRGVGEIAFMEELFRHFQDSKLNRFLFALGFVWQGLSFDAWRKILRDISNDEHAIYQFVWFASPYLALDVLGMIDTDTAVDDTAREFVKRHFRTGAPRGGSHERELMQEIGVDALAMWRRLESEGAPMKIKPFEMQ